VLLQAIPARPARQASPGPDDGIGLLAALISVLLAVLLSGCIDAPGDGVKVITVGASDYYGHVADFSGSGPLRDGRIKPDIVAPGVNVISAAPTGLSQLKYVDSVYAKASGTSLSTPVAAGVAALLLQKDPAMTAAGIKAALAGGARRLNNTLGENYESYYQGSGQIDAARSYQALAPDNCAVTPDRWMVGRWAFSEDSSYPGIDVGADLEQKRIYAMAPGDDDWTTKFLFVTNCPRKNVSVEILGDVSGWLTVMPLPRQIAANGQIIFAATIVVPEGTFAGRYSGSISIEDDGQPIAQVPVIVEVAGPLKVDLGSYAVNETIFRNEWHYKYVEVPVGTRNLKAQLSWNGTSNLDLFLLDPSGKCHVRERSRRSEEVSLSDPISGRYILAVHARSISSPQNYSLKVEESIIEVVPSSINLGRIPPGKTLKTELDLVNGGLPLDDLTFAASMESKSTSLFSGEVARDETWEKSQAVEENVSRLSLNLVWNDKERDLDLSAYDPSGESMGSSSSSSGTSEFLEIHNPPSGKWKLSVRGYKVPRDISQPFDLYVTSYKADMHPGVVVKGPSKVASGAVGSIDVAVNVPLSVEGQEKRGYIELNSNNYTIRIPVTYIVAGASIKDMAKPVFNDSDNDGFIDSLVLGVNVQAAAPGVYEVRGALNDCSGRMIAWITNSSKVDGSATINLDVDGREIWKRAGCGPLFLGEIFLYNPQGDLVEKYNASKSIEKEPQDFQAPAACYNGSFRNLSEARRGSITRVVVEAGVYVIKPGNYSISASLQREGGREVGSFDRTLALSPGNHTVALEFNAKKFPKLEEKTRLFLRDLTITADEEVVDEIDEAWSSGEMDFEG